MNNILENMNNTLVESEVEKLPKNLESLLEQYRQMHIEHCQYRMDQVNDEFLQHTTAIEAEAYEKADIPTLLGFVIEDIEELLQ